MSDAAGAASADPAAAGAAASAPRTSACGEASWPNPSGLGVCCDAQQTPSLQDTILRLQGFWAAQGCVLLAPADLALPFAAAHPGVFFAVSNPRPWRAAFLQPVRRPLDGRYGEHPFRLARHLQFEVVLKPAPADVQGLYVESLETLGLELAVHDLRFADGSWQPGSLGGSGQGWQVLADGLAVTRLTFLERLAERDLDAPCVEICYGLERLALVLQGAAGAWQLRWAGDDSDAAELRRAEEIELCRYAFEVADAGDLRRRLEVQLAEAERCLAAGLARAGYELSIRCLEPIDLLDARGELAARERAGWLDRVRAQVVAAAAIARQPPDSKPPPDWQEPPAGSARQEPAAKTAKPRRRAGAQKAGAQKRKTKKPKRSRSKPKRGVSGDGGAGGAAQQPERIDDDG